MSYRYLIVEQEGGICTLTLNRPETFNSWDAHMSEEMRSALREVQADAGIRVLIITGTGRSFAAGEDVNTIRDRDQAKASSQVFRSIARNFHNFLDDLEQIEIPVIAALNGVAAAGGMELALSCDLRIAAASAKVGFPELRVGLIPGSGGCSRLVKAVGLARAKEMVLLQRMIDADTALAYGLVTQVVPDVQLRDSARALAEQLCRSSPAALGMAKTVLQCCASSDLDTSRVLERLGNSVMVETPEHREAVAAFLEKRAPNFGA